MLLRGEVARQQAKQADEEEDGPDQHGDAPPVVVYTVGFDIGNDQNAKNIMSGCATDAAHAYLAAINRIKTAEDRAVRATTMGDDVEADAKIAQP